ncbi:hypothetical protein Tco_0827217 [Tanacetum coccineum]
MAAEIPQTLEYRVGQLNAAPLLEVENFTNWKKRSMCHIVDDQMNSVINYETSKATWEDSILYHEGPSDVKENRAMDLKKSLWHYTPLSTAFFSTFIVKDFQDSSDDEEDTRSSQEYMNDLEMKFHERALETDIQKESQKWPNQARDRKDKVKSKPKSVKVKSQPNEENTT